MNCHTGMAFSSSFLKVFFRSFAAVCCNTSLGGGGRGRECFICEREKEKNERKKIQRVEIKDWEHWGLQTWSDQYYCSFQHCNGLSLLTPERERRYYPGSQLTPSSVQMSRGLHIFHSIDNNLCDVALSLSKFLSYCNFWCENFPDKDLGKFFVSSSVLYVWTEKSLKFTLRAGTVNLLIQIQLSLHARSAAVKQWILSPSLRRPAWCHAAGCRSRGSGCNLKWNISPTLPVEEIMGQAFITRPC